MWRMHLFTGIQIVCLVVIYIVKHYKALTLAFPFVIVIISIFRHALVSRMFSDPELAAVRSKQFNVALIKAAMQLDGHDSQHEQENIYDMHANFSQYVPPEKTLGMADAPQT